MDRARKYKLVDQVASLADVERPGQAAMNILSLARPDLYMKILAEHPELDAFQESVKLDLLIEWLINRSAEESNG